MAGEMLCWSERDRLLSVSRNLTADLLSCEKESTERQIQSSVTVLIIRIR